MIALSGRGRKAIFIRQPRHEEEGGRRRVDGWWLESGRMMDWEKEENRKVVVGE